MIKNFINYLYNLKCDLSIWHENYKALEKEKFYKTRKVILLAEKKENAWHGKILVISYRKFIDIDEMSDKINWEYKPHKIYKAKLKLYKNISTSNKEIKKLMEDLFVYYFIEKKEKLKFEKM